MDEVGCGFFVGLVVVVVVILLVDFFVVGINDFK